MKSRPTPQWHQSKRTLTQASCHGYQGYEINPIILMSTTRECEEQVRCVWLGWGVCAIYIPRRKSGIYWIQVRRAAAAAAAVEISLWTR